MYNVHFVMHLQVQCTCTSTHGRLLLSLDPNALHKIEQQFTGHGLYADWQGVIVNVPGEDMHCHGEVGEREEGADVVY